VTLPESAIASSSLKIAQLNQRVNQVQSRFNRA
jgi:hypothetical protein